MSETDKAVVRDAIRNYARQHGPDIGMAGLGAYVRSTTGLDFAGPTLARLLKTMGYVREGERTIDTCPGRTVFYVLAPTGAGA